MVDFKKWQFWRLLDGDGQLAWVAVSRPKAHARIDRVKLWTLLPGQERLIANWFVSADHQLPEGERQWEHDSIDAWDFCEAAAEVPEPSKDDVQRIVRPERVLTFDQIDSIPLVRVTGKRDLETILRTRAQR